MNAEVLRAIDGVGVFPAISLLIFVAVFTGALIWAGRLDKARLDRFARLPLDEGKESAREDRPR
jgi:cytochrome c oxidase cbb3-type subunit 3